MGAFYLIRRNRLADEASLLERLDACMGRQGFGPPEALPSGTVLVRAFGKINAPADNVYRAENGDWAVCAGTFVFRGQVGKRALRSALETFDPSAPEWSAIQGHFCLILHRRGLVHLLTDRLGTYKVYTSPGKEILSSSFLALQAATGATTLSEQGVYEYVFQGATYGTGTILDGIEILDSSALWELGETVKEYRIGPPAANVTAEQSLEHHVETNLSNLRAYFATIAGAFPKIDTALSGGYDSRLCLALLREQGITPRLHVYGRDRDPDVTVAKAIAAGEALDLEVVDKSRFPKVEPRDFPEVVERNFWSFDGYPPDGILDNGSDLATRMNRCTNGEIMLNGGGGEIFRNFFYLPDGQYRAREILWAFYAQFDPRACGSAFSEERYFDRLEAKLLAAIGADRPLLSRNQVEAVYPMFRCRFWMGRNNSLNNRFGWALTPFAEFEVAKDTLAIPIRFKDHGAFEARLIREVDSRLASYPSEYGHDFSGKPPLQRVFKDSTTLFRPTISRRYSFRLRTRMRPPPRPYFLDPAYLRTIVDPGLPIMSQFFKIEELRDPGQYLRVCTLEYLAGRLSIG